jgi:hypothetical protein
MGGTCSPVAGSTIVGRLAALAVTVALAAACGPDGSAERPFQPTLPAVDLRPKLVLEVADDGVRARLGDRPDPAVRTDPPTVPGGSVVEVRNTGTREHRLRGGTAFDTGTQRPGEATTVVLTNPDPGPRTLDLVDVDADAPRGHLVVEPDRTVR